MAERASDLHDVGQRAIALLTGAPLPGIPQSDKPFVLLADDLSPADTAALDMSKTLGIITVQGSPTSHTAILARSRGIVAIVGAQQAGTLENGAHVIVNAARARSSSIPRRMTCAMRNASPSTRSTHVSSAASPEPRRTACP